MLSHDVLRDLTTAAPRRLIISVHARTDPRDPANTASTPAWLVELRNGLREISARLEASGDREDRLAFRTLGPRIEQELVALAPSERARSVSWMFDADGDSQRFRLQLPLRRDRVVADVRPFVSPLVDIVDRGAPTGIILVGSDLVRIMQIEQAEASEPENASFPLELGDWRPFGGTAGGSSERGRMTTSHEERYRARVQAQRDRLFETAASATAARLRELGWERIVLVMERQVAARFKDLVAPEIAERVVAELERNLVGEDLVTIADAVEPVIERAWLGETTAVARTACETARAGGDATMGADQTLGALAEGRVRHLILDPDHDFSAAAATVPPSIGGPPELLAERAVEAAVATTAQVSALGVDRSADLRDAGGMAALLRY